MDRGAPPCEPWATKHVSPTRRTWFGIASVALHALVLVVLTVLVRSVSMPEQADERPVEMVFAPPETEPAPPGQVAEAPLDSSPPEEQPPPPEAEPVSEPIAQPPPPKPKPPRVVRPAPRTVASMEPLAPVEAPPPVPAPPAPSETPTVDLAWQSAVSAWLGSHKTYPEDARRRGEQGHVAVRFTVDRSGRVLEADIAGSSGAQRLDDAAIALMRGAALPRFPASMTRERITITTMVRYTLR